MAIHIIEPVATFIHIPKTAGGSFARWCSENMDCDKKQRHCTIIEARNIWEDLGTTFTFVRNPFDRLVSLFHFIGQSAEDRLKNIKKGIPVKKGTSEKVDLLVAGYYKKGFENWVLERNNNIHNPFDLGDTFGRCSPMVFWTNNEIDIVIKMEELDTQIRLIEDLLHRKINMPHIHKTKRSDYRDYYNKETQSIVENWFKDDLDTFGY